MSGAGVHAEEEVPTGSNTFIHASQTWEGDRACLELVAGESPAETNVVAITYTATPDEWLDTWQTHVGARPATLGFVDIGGVARSAAAQPTTSSPPPGPISITTAQPADLLGILTQVRAYLDRWTDTNRRTVVWFETITDLLEHVDEEPAFRWQHLLTHAVREAGAEGYYRIDPTAHDPKLIYTFAPLFDDMTAVTDA